MPEVAVRAAGVFSTYVTPSERVEAVRGADLTVERGEFVCLMGPSGCGKSTLLALLSGIIAPDAGSIEIADQRLHDLDPDQRAKVRLRDIGVVFQRDELIAEFTAIENVMLPLELQGIAEQVARENAAIALERVDVGALAHRYPAQLSGGQRQRVGIARAIAGQRCLLLADEATGSLDRANTERIFALFGELARDGLAVIAATHDLLGPSFADRTIEMSDGALRQVGVESAS